MLSLAELLLLGFWRLTIDPITVGQLCTLAPPRACETEAVRLLQAMLAKVAEVQQSAGITETSLLNFVVSDGRTLIASRCVFPEQDAAASLYYSEGAAFQRSGQGSEDAVGSENQAFNAARESGSKAESRNPTNPASARDSSVTGKHYFGQTSSSIYASAKSSYAFGFYPCKWINSM